MSQPTLIKLHKQRNILELHFDEGVHFDLPCEYLRVYTPSAERTGHSAEQETLPVGKKNVGITAITPVGQYAVQLHFTDGHDSGFFSWNYLFTLGNEYETRWQTYLNKLQQANASR